MRDDLDKLLEEEMKNPKFQKEWEVLEVEFSEIQAEIDKNRQRLNTEVYNGSNLI